MTQYETADNSFGVPKGTKLVYNSKEYLFILYDKNGQSLIMMFDPSKFPKYFRPCNSSIIEEIIEKIVEISNPVGAEYGFEKSDKHKEVLRTILHSYKDKLFTEQDIENFARTFYKKAESDYDKSSQFISHYSDTFERSLKNCLDKFLSERGKI
jgi:hypothetical protein